MSHQKDLPFGQVFSHERSILHLSARDNSMFHLRPFLQMIYLEAMWLALALGAVRRTLAVVRLALALGAMRGAHLALALLVTSNLCLALALRGIHLVRRTK